MPLIKNLHLITEHSEKEKMMMEHAALEHSRHCNITFKFVEVDPKKVIIQIVQGKNSHGHHFDSKRLIEIVHETFDRFFKDRKVHVHPVPYKKSPVDSVDSIWVNKQMLERSIKLKTIAFDTGIATTQLSSLISGANPLSQPMKALFYYYFLNSK